MFYNPSSLKSERLRPQHATRQHPRALALSLPVPHRDRAALQATRPGIQADLLRRDRRGLLAAPQRLLPDTLLAIR